MNKSDASLFHGVWALLRESTAEINSNPTGNSDSGVKVNAVKKQYGCEDI